MNQGDGGQDNLSLPAHLNSDVRRGNLSRPEWPLKFDEAGLLDENGVLELYPTRNWRNFKSWIDGRKITFVVLVMLCNFYLWQAQGDGSPGAIGLLVIPSIANLVLVAALAATIVQRFRPGPLVKLAPEGVTVRLAQGVLLIEWQEIASVSARGITLKDPKTVARRVRNLSARMAIQNAAFNDENGNVLHITLPAQDTIALDRDVLAAYIRNYADYSRQRLQLHED